MSLILKVMHSYDLSPVDSDNPHTVYGDLSSCSFHRYAPHEATTSDSPAGYACVYQRDPVKTAGVPGFCEHERIIDLPAAAYLMNETGKTVSSFTAHTSGDPRGPNWRAFQTADPRAA